MADLEKEAEVVASQMKSMEAQLETIQKTLASVEKAQIRTNEEEKEVGKSYGFINAKKDIAMGKIAKAPLWDEKTTGKFNDYLHMVKEKDYVAIKKAWGDNVQDNVSNWVPTEFRSELVRLSYLQSIALQKATIIPMSRDKIDMPAPSGNYTVGWITSGDAISDSKITIGKVSLDTKKLGALALINNEDLADSAYPLALVVANQMAEDFGKAIDLEVFQSSGSAFSGLDSAASVQAVTGGVDATPTFVELLTEDNILLACGKLDDLQQDGAEWFFTPTAWNTIRALEDGASSKIVRLNEGYKYNLIGFPVNLSSRVGPVATVSKCAGFFGNMKHVYIGDRMDLSITTSDQYRFANDQTVFRAVQRLAIAVAIPTSFCKLSFGAGA
jgi:HK97 family phage major capsid protein